MRGWQRFTLERRLICGPPVEGAGGDPLADQSHGEGEAERAVLSALRWAFVLSCVILGVEAVSAFFARSLSLAVDAVHNVPDLFGFAISFLSLALTRKGATEQHTFGLHRTEVLATVVNASLVLGTGLLFGYEALVTLRAPAGSFAGPVDPYWILLGAGPTIVLRATAALNLRRLPQQTRDMNLRGVFLHLTGDFAITVVLLADATLLLLRPSLGWVDSAAALVISAVLVVESLPLFREAWSSLSERIPAHLSVEKILRVARGVPEVEDLHDIHVWSVCSSLVCMTAHVATRQLTVLQAMGVVADLKERMSSELGIVHAVFEVEEAPAAAPVTNPTASDPA
ncbi:MAG: cation diffusion facilitator family transporter [Thermoplasmata archaeon]|nr:cation diffusion facilitator family transporter [Thermoplasmata archaeon]